MASKFIKNFRPALAASLALLACAAVQPRTAQAIELNWSGQFRSEFHFINGYTQDRSDNQALDPGRLVGGTVGGAPSGYYIPWGGSTTASFQTLFLKLRPKLVVNDNIYIKSEWWLGDPVYGLFGNAVPYTPDQNQWYSTQSRGSAISAQRFWLELLTDFGTVQVGRVPLDWGLGVVWSSGEGQWDRYESTGDAVRLISKFGSFSFSPAFVIYSTGNNLGGTCFFNPATGVCTPGQGNGGVADYAFALKYENLEDDFDAGVNFVRRLGGDNRENSYIPPGNGTTTGTNQLNYNIWDVFGRKRLGNFSIAGELPIISGQMAGRDYSAVALATEASWKFSDAWETQLRFGHAPGQPGKFGGGQPDNYQGFYFNPNYKLGMIMFNYQLANLGGYQGVNTLNNPGATPNRLLSAYDNPITNANYLSAGASFRTQKWTFNGGVAYAQALQTAHQGENYFNTWRRDFSATVANTDQSSNLGIEYDIGAQFNWDEYFTMRLDTGLYFPGGYYAFSNGTRDNALDPVFGAAFRLGVTF